MSKVATMKLDDVAKIERGRFSPRPRNDPRYYGGNIPFVQTGDVSRAGMYIQEYSQTLNQEGLAVSKLFPKNTILMTIAANVGDVSILGFDSACPDSLVAFTPKEGIYNKWLFHVLSTMKRKFDTLSTQNAQKNLSLEKIKPVKIQVPSYDAQVDMASTLDAWDAAIEKTEALIDAKERQFGWLCQKFFTPNNDLTSSWQRRKIGEFVKQRKEKSPPTEDMPLYSLTIEDGVTAKTERYNREFLVKDKGNKTYKIVHPNDMVFNPANLRWGAIARSEVQHKVVLSPIYEVYQILDGEINADFLKYALTCKRQVGIFATKTEGTLIERMAVKADVFELCEISVPQDEELQKKIAETLNSARQEIVLLKKLADQYRTQKRGLMQKLLSGEWHIKNKEAA